jgi:hypothetical protein
MARRYRARNSEAGGGSSVVSAATASSWMPAMPLTVGTQRPSWRTIWPVSARWRTRLLDQACPRRVPIAGYARSGTTAVSFTST